MTLQEIIDNSKNIVFFGGAGVSTESGIPDFRSVDGLYNQQYDYPPEEILSNTFFYNNTKEFYRFYKAKMLCDAKPNMAHIKLAELEKAGKLSAIVTQNIDGLHQLAGSKCVYEIHGTTQKNYCTRCKKFFSSDYIKNSDEVPMCDECGSIIKPDVVLYEEALDNDTVNGAVDAISKADCLIVAGTSLTVYPAAGFIRYFRGKYFVIINKSETGADSSADLVIRRPVGEVLSEIIVS